MTWAIASDHGGFHLKDTVRKFLEAEGIGVEDLGTSTSDSVDYPDFAHKVAGGVQSGKYEYGVLICGTGLGMSMTANRYSGVRAALCTDAYMARMAKEHNNANIICMGERVLGPGLAEDIIRAFLKAGFEGGRHEARIAKIEAI